MTQIEQIKAELQKRLVKYDPDYTDAGQELQEMLAFIDSLPEKINGPVYDVSCGLSKTPPASKLDVKPRSVEDAMKELEDKIKLATPSWQGVDVEKYMEEVRYGEEPASPELEEELVNYFGAMPDDKDKIALARHFAEWQKKQDDELLTIAHFDGVQSGREAERKDLLEWAKQEQYESSTIVADDFWQKVIDKLQH